MPLARANGPTCRRDRGERLVGYPTRDRRTATVRHFVGGLWDCGSIKAIGSTVNKTRGRGQRKRYAFR